MCQIILLGNFNTSELFQMVIDELCIQQRKSPLFQMMNQKNKGAFTGIRLARKHTFTVKTAPLGQSVQSTNQSIITVPYFD